ncbi:CaiB/BaiF CoA transferase family protein [Clostridium transplantifaecale]|uniref:CaiB/BaiF CoA transferase family protein n=1 Tax=Clostridium transplantifaecale TaxID=2479838 RepID=UPI000F63430C|nr:CaiB/BaiF CoA-transferase family protein [Clostridium transplantifaecale]
MKPMERIRVIELSTMLAGPMTARILAEWGADVIKVESFNGDAWRKQAGTTMSPCTETANPNFDMQNLNKRFVSLNMRTKQGHDAMMKLLEGADVLVTNYRIQALKAMGLSYKQLKTEFPRLIHASVLGYGAEGPDKDRPGYDYTAFFSRTGIMADLPPAGAGPLVPIGGVGDHSVAVALAGGIAAALYRREITEEGDKVEVSLVQSGVFIGSTGVLNGFNGRKLPRNRYDCGHAGSNTYQGSDGEWFYLAVIDYRRFSEFCEVIGVPDIAKNPKYATVEEYYKNKAELTKIFDGVFARHPVSYWHDLLEAHDLPHEILRHFKDVPEDPQVQANHYAYYYEYEDGTKTVFVNGPVHFGSVDPAAIPCRTSGGIGRDTKNVLKEIGYTEEQIAKMLEAQEIK